MNLSQIISINGEQYRWIVGSYFRLWAVKFRLKFNGSEWLASKLRTCKGERTRNEAHSCTEADMQRAKHMHESVRIAARLHFTPMDCLPRSLVLVDMLKRKHKQAELKIGVAKDSGGLLASHAWVELSGEMVAEPESVGSNFTAIVTPDRDS